MQKCEVVDSKEQSFDVGIPRGMTEVHFWHLQAIETLKAPESGSYQSTWAQATMNTHMHRILLRPISESISDTNEWSHSRVRVRVDSLLKPSSPINIDIDNEPHILIVVAENESMCTS